MTTPMKADHFKSGMRKLAASVCIITSRDAEGRRCGLTATAVCSVSIDPPTLLCCVNKALSSYQIISESKRFSVNVLSTQDQWIATEFGRSNDPEKKFSAGRWTDLETGAPVLETALVSFDCRLSRVMDVATHGVLFGEVVAIHAPQTDRDVLIYGNAGYGAFTTLGL